MKSGVALLACLIGLVSITNAQSRSHGIEPQLRGGDSIIHGRATYKDNGKPARRVAMILINNTQPFESRMAITDDKGDFIFRKIRAGTYRVAAGFAGYTNGGLSVYATAREDGVEVTVDGSSSAQVKISAIRGAAITGRVTYPDGEPVIGAQINVYRKFQNRWEHAAVVTSGTETDDRGIYRIYPLRAGEYAISATEKSMTIEETEQGTTQSVQSNSINPYFYQDASTLQNATIVLVEAGGETSDINVTLTERATHLVAGTILINQKPFPGAQLRIRPKDNLGGPRLMAMFGPATKADGGGLWVFEGIPDGVYTIDLDHTSSMDRESQSNRFVYQPQEITVAGADLSGIIINLKEGGRITGTVVDEAGKPLPNLLFVTVEQVSANYQISTDVRDKKSGAFQLTGIPAGEFLLSATNLTQSYVKSITWKDRDLLRQPLKVEEGGEISGVRVVLSTNFGSLTGKVLSSQERKPLANVWYVLIPVDEGRWQGRSISGSVSGVTDNDGVFSVKGAPGEYYFLVLTETPQPPQTYLEAIKGLARKSPRVSLRTSTPNEMDVIIP